MKNQNKGFIIPALLGIIALLIIGGGVYIYQNKKVETPVTPVTVETSPAPTQVQQNTTQTSPISAQPKPSTNPASIQTTSQAKLFLQQMQAEIGTNYEITASLGYQNISGYKVNLPNAPFLKASSYLSTKLGAPANNYSSERSTGYENWHILCLNVGLGAGSPAGTLPYIFCGDKTGVQTTNVVVKDIRNINATDRTFTLMIGTENMRIQMPSTVQNTQYTNGTFADFVNTINSGKYQTSTFQMTGEIKGDVFQVTSIKWILG